MHIRKKTVLLVVAALVGVVVVGILLGGWAAERILERRLPALWSEVEERWARDYPSVFRMLRPLARSYIGLYYAELPGPRPDLPPVAAWTGRGAYESYTRIGARYDTEGRPISLYGSSGEWAEIPRRTIRVHDAATLRSAVRAAEPGDDIVLSPGTYQLSGKMIRLRGAGTARRPIVVRAVALGSAKLELDSLEGFYVSEPYWVFENLDIEGVCRNHGSCEHAFHVVGNARSTVIRNNRIHEYNAMIKVNGTGEDYPDEGLIERNSFYNSRVRQTDNPVTFIDIVAADNWVIADNLIVDGAKGGGDKVSYAAFIKGNASGGVFERNLVICELHVRTEEGARVGLSFGGGGTSAQACRGGDCPVESRNGIMRNNVVVHCSDVGIYLNQAAGARVLNNTLYNTAGIDVRFSGTEAIVANNVFTGRISDRDGGVSRREHNINVERGDWFLDPANGDFTLLRSKGVVDVGARLADVGDDFCHSDRTGPSHDLGAFEYNESLPACRAF